MKATIKTEDGRVFTGELIKENKKNCRKMVDRNDINKLIKKLDDLDEDDFFGTEGWRRYLGF